MLALRSLPALGLPLILCALSACGDDDTPSTQHDSGAQFDFANAEPIELVHAFLYRDSDADAGMPPAEVKDGDVRLALRGGRGHVLYVAQLGCADPYAALIERDGSEARLLLRFTGPGHNACGAALYAMRVVLPNADASTRVTVYRQDDVPGPIERIGSAGADGDDADCASLTECSSDQACPYEGSSDESLGPVDGPPDTNGCATLPVCSKSVCAWRREACMMTCGTPDCAILESFPVQVRCTD